MLAVERFGVNGRDIWIGVIFHGRIQGISFAFTRGELLERIRNLAEFLRGRDVRVSLDVQPSNYTELVYRVLIGELENEKALPELSFEGVTPFERRVYEWLTKNVKRGTVITYGSLAKALETSPRAVGGAMKRNPYPIIVPCHRVVSREGIGHYNLGIEEKKFLLELEGVKEWTG
ncbi:methylated-DNA--protein-cysteine methyltransferase [Thermococcus gammatolerans]|uniref:Methylated-DNA--protein-cysteine methyltransferase n=1 Tax=Thermococcus gammatolerans (strain DSM 15229 / JCM 11827 / EJ3) TaxID=593117 RepID=OGT_THEGJ|nr:methylated-DNA--protein-cysteine methyltransferase [Thermococcus gammatolerans]C5A3L5.1 RecName: Full=Methylated-DNA--protein-cysteine methyltransferase; AltName: Full=6-O-methylguanine-DNA methyltransferase; Short=MGMT; AltName: Full=O-6-methylguanine-DNA-alkyltransferase [Thermococcus gammatolerans EJ3]ACS32827.1 Methylated-DNA--protein-cysteine methyltransferase (ogt) [Thermococcus gammatolerans EJ3]